MTIQDVSMTSIHFERYSISPSNLGLNPPLYNELEEFAFMKPEELEKRLSRYASSKLKSILDNGATMQNELLRRTLSAAAYYANTHLIEYVVRKWGLDPINMGDEHGTPPLGWAISSIHWRSGHRSADLLIQLGAKVNILIERNAFGRRETLLEHAIDISISNGKDLSLIQLFLRNGARIENPTNLDAQQLKRLKLAQTRLAPKIEIAEKRAKAVKNTLAEILPTALITIINAMEEEPLCTAW